MPIWHKKHHLTGHIMLQITVNGDAMSVNEGHTISDLITTLGLENKRLAVELNRDIVSRSEFSNTVLRNGDTVEIVQAIGGG
jgi:sulfur carrier protein